MTNLARNGRPLNPDDTPASLTTKALRGLTWSYTSTFAIALMQVAVTAVLARLLTPTDYGLMAMAMVAVQFSQYFSQMGLAQAVVQRPQLNPADVRAALTGAILLGVTLCGVLLVAAPLVASLFEEPDVTPVLRLLSINLALGGVSMVPLALLRRTLRFRTLASVEVTSFVLGYPVTGIALAIAGMGVWSLAFAACIQALSLAVLSHAVEHRHGLPSRRLAPLKRLLSFGSRVSLISIFEFLVQGLPTVWLGRVLGSRPLGIYSRAYNLVGVPMYHLGFGLTRVLLPTFSRVQGERARVRGALRSAATVLAAIAAPVFWAVAAASGDVVAVLLGPRWEASALPLAILAVAAPFGLVDHLCGVFLEAMAALNGKLVFRAVQLTVLALLLAVLHASVADVALAVALSLALGCLGTLALASRAAHMRLPQLAAALVPGAAIGLVTAAAVTGVAAAARGVDLPPVAALAVEVGTALAVLVAGVLRGFGGRLWIEVRSRLEPAVQAGGRPARALAWCDRHAHTAATCSAQTEDEVAP